MSEGNDIQSSYDIEFGSHAGDIQESIQAVIDRIGKVIGTDLKNIVDVVTGEGYSAPEKQLHLSEKELRVIRFAMTRALDSI